MLLLSEANSAAVSEAIPCLGPYFLGFQQTSPSALTRCLRHHSYTRLGACPCPFSLPDKMLHVVSCRFLT